MKPRAIVVDLMGDYIRYAGGEIRLRALIALLAHFGVNEGTARMVLARMRTEGWFDARSQGREAVYALSGRAWQMLDEGRARIFERAGGEWGGTWAMVLYAVPETERSLRDELRKTLTWLGFGPLGPSTWVCPHDRLDAVEERYAARPGLRLDLFTSRSRGIEADRELAARCWDIAALERDYADLLAAYGPRLAAYRSGGLDPGEALVERMRLVQAYRQFPFRDPDLPPELLPAGWPGGAAHDTFVEAHALLREPAERAYRELTS